MIPIEVNTQANKKKLMTAMLLNLFIMRNGIKPVIRIATYMSL